MVTRTIWIYFPRSDIFVIIFLAPEGSENKETKISELGKYISYCTLSRAITITYHNIQLLT